MALGQRIKEIRINQGLSMEEFGKLLDASKGNVSMWESGKVTPNNLRLKAIADIAGISVDELLDDTCQWKYNGKFTYITSCYRTFFDDENYNHVDNDFEYCPYCGKRIKFEEE